MRQNQQTQLAYLLQFLSCLFYFHLFFVLLLFPRWNGAILNGCAFNKVWFYFFPSERAAIVLRICYLSIFYCILTLRHLAVVLLPLVLCLFMFICLWSMGSGAIMPRRWNTACTQLFMLIWTFPLMLQRGLCCVSPCVTFCCLCLEENINVSGADVQDKFPSWEIKVVVFFLLILPPQLPGFFLLIIIFVWNTSATFSCIPEIRSNERDAQNVTKRRSC